MQSPETPCRLALWSGAMTLWLVLSNAGASQASLIQYEYSGVITSVDPSTGVAAGTPFSGIFAYDPTKPPGYLAIEGSNEFFYGTAGGLAADGSELTLQVGGQTVLSNPGGVTVGVAGAQFAGQWGYSNTTPFMNVSIGANNQAVNSGPTVGLSFMNPDQAVFSSLAPPPYLNLADFPHAQLSVTELTNPGEKTLYTGTIASLTEIPEPTSATVFSAIAAAWLVRALRQRARRSAA